jgi:DNA polymerase III alpha subunit
MAVKGLSASGADAIIAERTRNGDFLSLADFTRRVKLGRDDIIALTPSGAFDRIAPGLSRPMQAPADLASACLELAAWNMSRYKGHRIGTTGIIRGSGKDGEHLEMSMP